MSYILTDYCNPNLLGWNRVEEAQQEAVAMMDAIQNGETTIHDLYEELQRCEEQLQDVLDLFEGADPPTHLDEVHQGYITQLEDLINNVGNLASETMTTLDNGPEDEEELEEFEERILEEVRSFFEDLDFDFHPPA